MICYFKAEFLGQTFFSAPNQLELVINEIRVIDNFTAFYTHEMMMMSFTLHFFDQFKPGTVVAEFEFKYQSQLNQQFQCSIYRC